VHEYSIDKSPKVRVLFWLSATAIYASPFINAYITAAFGWLHGLGIFSKSLAVAVPTFLLFVVLYQVVDKWLWRFKAVRHWLLVPDLNGTWRCEGITKVRRGQVAEQEWVGRIQVVQSWSRMSVRLATSQSASTSSSASVRKDPHGFRLTYTYRNDPRPGEEELAIHDGIAEIDFGLDYTVGDGKYFTDQHRQTVGSMRWTKE
jgi:SMODS-associating 2TM, beta-strand rich effector domain